MESEGENFVNMIFRMFYPRSISSSAGLSSLSAIARIRWPSLVKTASPPRERVVPNISTVKAKMVTSEFNCFSLLDIRGEEKVLSQPFNWL